jgi:hypothetical protein
MIGWGAVMALIAAGAQLTTGGVGDETRYWLTCCRRAA